MGPYFELRGKDFYYIIISKLINSIKAFGTLNYGYLMKGITT